MQTKNIYSAILVICYCLTLNPSYSAESLTSNPKSTTKANSGSSIGTARNIRKLYGQQPATKRYSYSSMPDWWKREYSRKQNDVRMIKYNHAREAVLYNKAMANPNSPEALNYKRVYALAHPKSTTPQGKSKTLPKVKTNAAAPKPANQHTNQ